MAKEAVQEEWESVTEGARPMVSFETIGDTLIGTYAGTQVVTPENGDDPWTQYLFDDVKMPAELAGENVAVNAGYDLRRVLDTFPPNTYRVRVAYVRDVPVKNFPSPMKSFQVDRQKIA